MKTTWTIYHYYPKLGEWPRHPQWFAYETFDGHVREIIGPFETKEEAQSAVRSR